MIQNGKVIHGSSKNTNYNSKVAKRHSTHWLVGQGEPEGCEKVIQTQTL